MKEKIKQKIQNNLFQVDLNNGLFDLYIHKNKSYLNQEIQRRIKYFLSTEGIEVNIYQTEKIPFLLKNPTLYAGFNISTLQKKIYGGLLYNLDYENNSLEAWEYHFLLSKLNALPKHDLKIYQEKFSSIRESFISLGYKKSYIFGTGSSLAKALDYSWEDGIRIVCNTIVKDQVLWNHINPHIIAAGDAIYHFGIGKFPQMFRADLKERLRETPNTIFIYPSFFHSLCIKEFSEFRDRLLPIPIKKKLFTNFNLTKSFFLPDHKNVFTILLLPIALSLTRNIFLWGFDGKAPQDKDFWKNSEKQFYQNEVEELKRLHPAFYSSSLSVKDPYKYIKEAHGDNLENMLRQAEKDNFKIISLHRSFTPAFQKRLII